MSENKSAVNLEQFLSDVASAEVDIHNYGELDTKRIISLLCDFGTLFRNTSVYPEKDKNQQDADMLYTRLAALLSLWLSTEDIQFTPAQFFDFMLCKPTISAIFYASGFRGTGHLINYLSNKADDGSLTIPKNRIMALLCVIHIDDLTSELLDVARKIEPNYYLVLVMGWLNSTLVLTKQGEYNRRELVKDSELLLRLESNQRFLDGLLNIWMNISYFSCDNRYYLKKNINKMLSNYMEKNYGKLKPKKNFIQSKGKPKLVIIHERLSAGHAMFRCYHPHFVQLENFFDVTSIVETEFLDQAGKDLFPSTIEVKNTANLEKVIKEIQNINPDIILYPSLGMCRWTVMLANTRLAPMQVLACGHPDTSCIPTIDFIWGGGLPEVVDQFLSEICLHDSQIGFNNVQHPDLSYLSIERDISLVSLVDIAINCTKMKLNASFLDVLKEIKSKNKDRIRFNFFPCVVGIEYDCSVQMIKKIFPDSIVHPAMSYGAFIKELGKCYMSLSPFPFGNTNSSIDALLLGMPVVAKYGNSLQLFSDHIVLESVNMSEFACRSEVDYINLVGRLLDDADFYSETVACLKDADVKKSFFRNDDKESFAHLLYKAFKNLSKIKRKNIKAVDFSILDGLEGESV